MDIIRYNKVATILLKQKEPVSIEKLSLIANIPIAELEIIIDFFGREGFLKEAKNTKKIELSLKAKKRD